MPKLSIIVPVYNVQKYLPHCIDSILAQTFTDFEVILVDDGSPDECGKIIDEYAQKDGRIKAVHQKNMGLGAARNTGISYARGKYLSFIDSDDMISPYMYSVLCNYLDSTNADLAIGGIVGLDLGEEPVFSDVKQEIEPIIWNNKECMEQVFSMPPTIQCSCCNKVFRRKGNDDRFREEIPMLEDILYLTNYLIHCEKVVYCPEAMYYYVRRTGSITRSNPNVFLKGLEIRKEVADRLKKEMPEVYDSAFYSYTDWCIQTINRNREDRDTRKQIIKSLRQSLPTIILSRKYTIKQKLFYVLKSLR